MAQVPTKERGVMDLILHCLMVIWCSSGLARTACTSNGLCSDLTSRSVHEERQQLHASAAIDRYSQGDGHEGRA